ncbi:response regulator [Azospirillum sp. sgz302134]
MSQPSQPFHVIVAEDDAVVAVTVAEALEALGYRVTIGRNGFDAIKIDQADPADVLITDIRMPHVDGTTLISRMRELRPELPILVTSGCTEQLPEEEPGQLAVVPKPFTEDAIIRNVKALLGVQ